MIAPPSRSVASQCADAAVTVQPVTGNCSPADKALVLPELLRTYLGQEPPADGVLLTVPSRHRLAFHLSVDEHAVSAVNALASFGLGAYQDAVGDGQPPSCIGGTRAG
ncbi:hypothetical protein [Streptomyces syringium]|uniref:hypothetical protein n=1 Tax=Streptomyces syringium TaxID=76729 RepID=UPI0034245B1E